MSASDFKGISLTPAGREVVRLVAREERLVRLLNRWLRAYPDVELGKETYETMRKVEAERRNEFRG